MQQERSKLLEEGTHRYQEWERHVMEKALATPESRARYEDLVESFDLWLLLVEARREAGTTCAEIARRAGLTKKQVRQIEQNRLDTCRVDALKRYATAVGMHLRMTLVEREPGSGKGQDLV